MLLNQYLSKLRDFLGSLIEDITMFGRYLARSQCKMLLRKWKPSLIVIGEELGEADRVSLLGNCIGGRSSDEVLFRVWKVRSVLTSLKFCY